MKRRNISLVRKTFSGTADAIICGNDYTAARLLDSLRKLKIKVPRDIKVTGVDDVHYSTLVSPQLATIRQPCEQIAAAAFQLPTERISNPGLPAREVLLDAELVIRGSTRTSSKPPVSHAARSS